MKVAFIDHLLQISLRVPLVPFLGSAPGGHCVVEEDAVVAPARMWSMVNALLGEEISVRLLFDNHYSDSFFFFILCFERRNSLRVASVLN